MLNSQRVQDRSKGKWGNPHNPYQFDIMWGFSSCVGSCWQHHGNHSIDWPMSLTVHSAGLVMWDIGFLLASLAPSWCVLAVVSRVPGRHVCLPFIWFWMTLKGSMWSEAETTVTKHSEALKWGQCYQVPTPLLNMSWNSYLWFNLLILYHSSIKKVSLHTNLKSKSIALFEVTD